MVSAKERQGGGADDDAEGVGGDRDAGAGDAALGVGGHHLGQQAVGDAGQQAHGDEFGAADAEAFLQARQDEHEVDERKEHVTDEHVHEDAAASSRDADEARLVAEKHTGEHTQRGENGLDDDARDPALPVRDRLFEALIADFSEESLLARQQAALAAADLITPAPGD